MKKVIGIMDNNQTLDQILGLNKYSSFK